MKKIHLTLIGLLFLLPLRSEAAKLFFDAPKSASTGEETRVDVMIDTGTDKINAVSGTVTFDPTSFSVSKIIDGGSAVTLWIDQPKIAGNGSSISFSGLTPGGFQGDVPVFSFVLKPVHSGTASLGMQNALALKNDGQGTQAKTTIEPKSIQILADISASAVTIIDVDPPEDFAVDLLSSPDVFEGRPALSFTAVDKGTGIDRYEYAATWFGRPNAGSWVPAESPFLVPETDSLKLLFIRAVDRNGNEKTASTATDAHYELVLAWVILIALLLCALLFFTRRLRRSRS